MAPNHKKTHGTKPYEFKGSRPTIISHTLVLLCSSREVPGEGPDHAFPEDLVVFGPIPARARGVIDF